jgi:hypothetical protein
LRVSPSVFPALAVKLRFAPAPKLLPVEAGLCEEQVGGTFFTIFQLFVAVEGPFEYEATKVLVPGESFKSDEFKLKTELVAPWTTFPFKLQVTWHEASFAVATN